MRCGIDSKLDKCVGGSKAEVKVSPPRVAAATKLPRGTWDDGGGGGV